MQHQAEAREQEERRHEPRVQVRPRQPRQRDEYGARGKMDETVSHQRAGAGEGPHRRRGEEARLHANPAGREAGPTRNRQRAHTRSLFFERHDDLHAEHCGADHGEHANARRVLRRTGARRALSP